MFFNYERYNKYFFIKYNTVFWLQSDQDPWERLGAGGTFSEKNILTKNQGLLKEESIVTLPAKSEVQTVFRILPDDTKI